MHSKNKDWYLITSDKVQATWVEAESELGAKRVHATYYGDDQTLDIEDHRDAITLNVELEGNEQPFRALTERDDGAIEITEKRVNQAGSKGLYRALYDPQ